MRTHWKFFHKFKIYVPSVRSQKQMDCTVHFYYCSAVYILFDIFVKRIIRFLKMLTEISGPKIKIQ